MKKTDVIIPLNANFQKNTLNIVVISTPKHGVQMTELPSTHPKFIVVPVEADQWVKVSIDERQTIKLGEDSINSVFSYICYNLDVEPKGSERDPKCDYFVGCSYVVDHKSLINKDDKKILSKSKEQKEVKVKPHVRRRVI